MAKKKSKKQKASGSISTGDGGGLMVDPTRVRFQHARIRPIFSGCGRSVEGTLDEIRKGITLPTDLPPIQVLVGPNDDQTGEPWYFSLNNRRLWVLKRCREEGLLPNNQIYARVRKPKSEQETSRYTVENCALEARIIPEKSKGPKQAKEEWKTEPRSNATYEGDGKHPVFGEIKSKLSLSADFTLEPETSDVDSESSDEEPIGSANRFSALL